jgi:hypothetical protein
MVYVNTGSGEISLKIVYVSAVPGDGLRSLQMVKAKLPPSNTGEIISIATQSGQTLFFDFLPISLGQVNSYRINIKLYAAPEAQYYEAPRKLVVNGADCLIFIADPAKEKRDSNLSLLENIMACISEEALDIPIIFQWNYLNTASDSDLFTPDELNSMLNMELCPAYAVENESNVLSVLKETVKLALAVMS